MPLKIPDVGEIEILKQILGQAGGVPLEGLTIRLYQNDVTPSDTDTLATFTECNFSGYVEQSLLNWSPPATVNDKAESQADAVSYTHDGGPTSNQVYGYFVTDSAKTILYYAERDPAAPRSMAGAGDKITIAPKFTLSTEF